VPGGSAVDGDALDADEKAAALPTISIRGAGDEPNACARTGAATPAATNATTAIRDLRWKRYERMLTPIDAARAEKPFSERCPRGRKPRHRHPTVLSLRLIRPRHALAVAENRMKQRCTGHIRRIPEWGNCAGFGDCVPADVCRCSPGRPRQSVRSAVHAGRAVALPALPPERHTPAPRVGDSLLVLHGERGKGKVETR